jgi:hypothetical protein
MRHLNTSTQEDRNEWVRTGATSQEASHNKRGIIYTAQERCIKGPAKGARRMVQTGYKSVIVED